MKTQTYNTHFNFEKTYWWFRGRRAIVRAVLDRYVGHVLRTLDVGCGTGYNGFMLRTYTTHLAGIDMSKDAIKYARSYHVYDTADVGELPLKNIQSHYDLITLFDVLEHIEHDADAVRSLVNHLNPGGKIVFTVLALSLLWSRHDESVLHYRRYTKKMLRALICDIPGVTMQLNAYYNFFLFLPIFFVRVTKIAELLKHVFKKADAIDDGTDFFTLPRPLNTFFEKLMSFERSFVVRGFFPIGVSLVVVIKKNE